MERNHVIIGFLVGAILILYPNEVTSAASGPYEITNIQVTACEDQGTNAMSMQFQMYRTADKSQRTMAHRGRITYPVNSQPAKVRSTFYKKGTDWILFTEYNEYQCEMLDTMPVFYESLTSIMGINKTCPFPPGEYLFEEWIIDAGFLPPILPYGHYKAIVNIENVQNEVMGCVMGFGDVVKKYPKLPK